ncbi:MAG: YdeI/OmpD-associated family protein [Acidobacteriota bacterium]|nr:MAG: YdeI/OmpD-associated family protein [Acidobacteriota bacterium]
MKVNVAADLRETVPSGETAARMLLEVSTRNEWRRWLTAHHRESKSVWITLYKQGKREGVLTLSEAIEEALCFGWIDGKLRSLDDEKYSLRFSPRRPNSIWSIHNVRRVETLIDAGLMTDEGLSKVAEARQNGQWDAAIRREQTDEIPDDLLKGLRRTKGAIAAYRALPSSRKKQFLHWLFSARKPETRQRRIESILLELESGASATD